MGYVLVTNIKKKEKKKDACNTHYKIDKKASVKKTSKKILLACIWSILKIQQAVDFFSSNLPHIKTTSIIESHLNYPIIQIHLQTKATDYIILIYIHTIKLPSNLILNTSVWLSTPSNQKQ